MACTNACRYLEFQSPDAAQKALAGGDLTFEGYTVHLEPADAAQQPSIESNNAGVRIEIHEGSNTLDVMGMNVDKLDCQYIAEYYKSLGVCGHGGANLARSRRHTWA